MLSLKTSPSSEQFQERRGRAGSGEEHCSPREEPRRSRWQTPRPVPAELRGGPAPELLGEVAPLSKGWRSVFGERADHKMQRPGAAVHPRGC